MTDDELHQRAVVLYDRFTHEHGDRRAFMREMALLAGGAVAAEGLLASISANPAAAAVIAATDPRLKARTIGWTLSEGRTLSGYTVQPARQRGKSPSVIVIHENRGLTEHGRDVARRVALLGYVAVAPDFLTPLGGTPSNEDLAREQIGKLDLAATVADAVATVRMLRVNGSVGAIGFAGAGRWSTALRSRRVRRWRWACPITDRHRHRPRQARSVRQCCCTTPGSTSG